jgi:hypothetical protein
MNVGMHPPRRPPLRRCARFRSPVWPVSSFLFSPGVSIPARRFV